jgi:hypothetical protein
MITPEDWEPPEQYKRRTDRPDRHDDEPPDPVEAARWNRDTMLIRGLNLGNSLLIVLAIAAYEAAHPVMSKSLFTYVIPWDGAGKGASTKSASTTTFYEIISAGLSVIAVGLAIWCIFIGLRRAKIATGTAAQRWKEARTRFDQADWFAVFVLFLAVLSLLGSLL